jgi:hypothetical protein
MASSTFAFHFANEGPMRILMSDSDLMYSQKCHSAASLFPKQNYNVLSPNFNIHVSVSDSYIPRNCLPILLQPNRLTDPGNI